MKKIRHFPCFFACGLESALKNRLITLAEEHAEVVEVDTFAELQSLIADRRARRIAAVILGSHDSSEVSALPFLRKLRQRRLDAPIILATRAGLTVSQQLRDFADAGVHEFLFEGTDDSLVALRKIVASAVGESTAGAVLRLLDGHIPKRLRPFVETCIGRSGVRSLEEIARNMGMHRATLFRYCEQAGFPPPTETRFWCRLMLAAQLLEHTTRTVESIGEELEFPSINSLRNMMKDYMQLTPVEVREGGGLACVVEGFLASRTNAPQSAEPEPGLRHPGRRGRQASGHPR